MTNFTNPPLLFVLYVASPMQKLINIITIITMDIITTMKLHYMELLVGLQNPVPLPLKMRMRTKILTRHFLLGCK